jgi:hypothetical protein
VGDFVAWRVWTADHRTLLLLVLLTVTGTAGFVTALLDGRWLDALVCLGLAVAGIAGFIAPLLFHRLWIQGWRPGGRHSATPRLPWRRP